MPLELSCGAVVFTRVDGELRYLVIRSPDGLFHSFHKGHMEPGETEQETALREIREEVGLRPQLIEGFRMEDEHPLPKKPGVIKQVVYFLVEYEDQEISYQKEELLSAPLVSYEEAVELFAFESSKRILTEAHHFLQNL